MNDPFTMLYDAWSLLYHHSPNLPPGGGRDGARADQESAVHHHPPPPPVVTTDQDHVNKQQEPDDEPPTSEAPRALDVVWTAICVLHMVACAGIATMLVPSIVLFQPSMLPCNSISGVPPATAWPVINCCLLLAALSLVACRVVLSVLRLPQLALCMAMHATARLMLSFANAAVACPLPPIAMPSAFASGVGVCIGVLLLVITQMHDACSDPETFDPADFYMNHAWASCVLMMGMRHIVYRAALALQGLVVRHVVGFASSGAHEHRD